MGLLGCGGAAFACEDDTQCSSDGSGQCELSGYCSFPDESCPSGRRYGDAAGGGFSGKCVRSDDASTETSLGSSSGGTTEPSTTTLDTTTGTDSTSTSSSSSPTASTSTTSTETGTSTTTSTVTTEPASESTDDSSGDGCAAGFECVPDVPTGWEGPFYVLPYAGGDPPPSCPSGRAPIDLGTAFSSGDGSCSCGCDPQPGECSTVVDYHTDDDCTGTALSEVEMSSADCLPVGVEGSIQTPGQYAASGNSCGGSAEAQLPEPQTTAWIRLCGEAAGDCEDARREYVRPEPTATRLTCISQAGVHACEGRLPGGLCDGRDSRMASPSPASSMVANAPTARARFRVRSVRASSSTEDERLRGRLATHGRLRRRSFPTARQLWPSRSITCAVDRRLNPERRGGTDGLRPRSAADA